MATSIMATAIMATLSATMIIGINGLNLQNANAQTSQPGITSNASSATNATAFITVNPSQSTDKEFWINTVHFDGNTNVHPGVMCDTCPQNTPLHPARTASCQFNYSAGRRFQDSGTK